MRHGLCARAPGGSAAGSGRGFALADVVVAMILMTIAVGGLVGSVTWGLKLHQSNREAAIAEQAARSILAELRTVPFADIFATWSAAPNVEVRGLNARPDDPDGMVGEIIFPTALGVSGLELRENVDLPVLGMPRDLNGDGLPPDGADHAGDYVILPVTVRLEWRGTAGDARQEYHTVLTL